MWYTNKYVKQLSNMTTIWWNSSINNNFSFKSKEIEFNLEAVTGTRGRQSLNGKWGWDDGGGRRIVTTSLTENKWAEMIES